MKEINFNLSYCITKLVLTGGLVILIIYIVIRLVTGSDESLDNKLIAMVIGMVFLLWSIKTLSEVLLTLLRFYGLRIEMLKDKLILRTKTKEYEIPMNRDTNVVYCMDGWLIAWPSEKNEGVILLTRDLFGDQFLELCFYFQENANYIPSERIIRRSRYGFSLDPCDLDYYQPNADYVAAEEEEEKLLKSLGINKSWLNNRLKYIKWPS